MHLTCLQTALKFVVLACDPQGFCLQTGWLLLLLLLPMLLLLLLLLLSMLHLPPLMLLLFADRYSLVEQRLA